jgi:hypothetical protein
MVVTGIVHIDEHCSNEPKSVVAPDHCCSGAFLIFLLLGGTVHCSCCGCFSMADTDNRALLVECINAKSYSSCYVCIQVMSTQAGALQSDSATHDPKPMVLATTVNQSRLDSFATSIGSKLALVEEAMESGGVSAALRLMQDTVTPFL